MKKFIAFSGGVESTTMCLMFGHDAQPIFADTGFEHRELYARIDEVEDRLKEIHGPEFTIVRIRREKYTLPEEILRRKFYPSPRMRFCTRMFKIEPMDKYLKELGDCELMIGLNADEAEKRTGNHGLLPNVHYGYPLVDLGITREDCIGVLKAHDLEPRFPIYMARGGCVGCFYKSKAEWKAMVHLAPDEIEELIQIEKAIQDRRGKKYGIAMNLGGFQTLEQFAADESNSLLSADEMYPERYVTNSTPCGVFCHR